MTEEKRYEEVDAAELFDRSGILFEINRIVLHPLGYHLGVPVVDGKKTLWVIDYKDVEGGLAFGRAEWKEGKDKVKAFNKEREVVVRITQRARIFGTIIQETSDGPRPRRSKDPGERRPSSKPRR